MKITVIKKSGGKVKTVSAACPWILNDEQMTKS